jgi:hypothetical protein
MGRQAKFAATILLGLIAAESAPPGQQSDLDSRELPSLRIRGNGTLG